MSWQAGKSGGRGKTSQVGGSNLNPEPVERIEEAVIGLACSAFSGTIHWLMQTNTTSSLFRSTPVHTVEHPC